jgi:hypothetical protein
MRTHLLLVKLVECNRRLEPQMDQLLVLLEAVARAEHFHQMNNEGCKLSRYSEVLDAATIFQKIRKPAWLLPASRPGF